MHLNVSSAKRRPFWLGFNELRNGLALNCREYCQAITSTNNDFILWHIYQYAAIELNELNQCWFSKN